MAEPADLPLWATTAVDIEEPTDPYKQAGWLIGQKPPAEYFNWWMNNVYLWVDYFRPFMADIIAAQADIVTLQAPGILLDGARHSDTLNGAVTYGDLMVGNATPKWTSLAKGTADQVLKMNSAGTTPQWGTAALWNLSVQSSNVTTSASMQDIPGLTINMISGSVYHFKGQLIFNSGGAGDSYQVCIITSSGTVSSGTITYQNQGTTNTMLIASALYGDTNPPALANTIHSTHNLYSMWVDGFFTCSGTGVAKFQFKATSASGSMLLGSYIEYLKVN